MTAAPRRAVAGIALLAALGLALMLPVLLAPTPLSDSHAITLVWSHQFTALVAAGDLWPRWLPWSHDGLGAPVFYFYGPFAFWVVAAFGIAGLATWLAIAAAATALLIASGFGMHALLRARGAPRPLAGAALYMAAPYHLLDFARRGALAEFAAMALVPLVALALPRAAAGRPAAFAMAYAALILTHLPLALLFTTLLLPMLAAECCPERRAIVRMAGAAALGLGIACAYLVPALALQRYTAMATMHAAPLLRPSNWTPATYWRGAAPAHLLLLAIGVALGVAMLAVRGPARWRWYVLGTLALAFGFLAPVWSLPALNQVQFPWRALALAEFGMAMLVGHSGGDGARLLAMLAPILLLSILVLAPSAAMIGAPEPAPLTALFRLHPDVPEYRPRGVEPDTATLSRRALALARATPPVRVDHGMLTLRRAAFPIWEAACGGRRQPSGTSPDGLLRVPAGCAVVRVLTPAERIGDALSIVALLLVAAMAVRRTATLPEAVRPT